MAFSADFDKLVVDKWVKVVGLDRTTSELLFMFDEIKDGNIENTEDKAYITGAGGVNLAGLKRNKAARISFNNAYLVMSAMGTQTGSGVDVASAQNTFTVPVIEYIKNKSATEATLSETPVTGTLKYVYSVNKDMTQNEKYELTSSSPAGNQFSISGKDLTFPASTWSATAGNDTILAIYDTEVTVGKKVSNKGNEFSKDAYVIAELLCRDVCNNNDLYFTKVVVPYASVDGNFTIATGDTPEPQAFSAESLPDPCSTDRTLWDWFIVE